SFWGKFSLDKPVANEMMPCGGGGQAGEGKLKYFPNIWWRVQRKKPACRSVEDDGEKLEGLPSNVKEPRVHDSGGSRRHGGNF
ncbi:hypothetical protein KI387_008219, partial [Taxus chinensis]